MIFSAWAASGKNSPCPSLLPVRSITRMVRVSTLPWPTERTRAASGTAAQGSALSRVCSVFWLPLIRSIQCAPRARRSAASSRAVNPASTVITESASRSRSSRAAASFMAAATSPPLPASGAQATWPRVTPLAESKAATRWVRPPPRAAVAVCSGVARGADPRSVLPSMAITRRPGSSDTRSTCAPAAIACRAANRPTAQPATAASSAAGSVPCTQRRSVASHGSTRSEPGQPSPRQSSTAWPCAAAHSPIATYDVAPLRHAHAPIVNTPVNSCRRPRRCRASGTAASAAASDNVAPTFPAWRSATSEADRWAGRPAGSVTGAWSLNARAGEDAIAGTGSHGRGRLQHPHPATRARARPQAMIRTASPQVTTPMRDFAGALGPTRVLGRWRRCLPADSAGPSEHVEPGRGRRRAARRRASALRRTGAHRRAAPTPSPAGASGTRGSVRGGDDAVDRDLQVARAAQDRVVPVRRRVDDQARVDQPAGQLGKGDLGLQPGQRGAEAVVDAAAEAEVLIRVPGETEPVGVEPVRIEAVGIADVVGVAAAGGEDQQDPGALRDGGAGDLDVVEGVPVRQEVHWRLVAQQLLDQVDGQLGVAAQPLEHLGVAQ